MKKVTLLAVLASVALVGCGVGNLDQGQVKYTPGVPPWQEKDPSKKGPGAAPGGGGPGGGGPGAGGPAAPAQNSQNSAQAPPGGGPPGMTAPERGMGKP